MSASTRLLSYAVLLALIFVGAILTGRVLNPTHPKELSMSSHSTTKDHEAEHGGGSKFEHHVGSNVAGADPAAGGLAVSQGGYSFEPSRTFFEEGRPAQFSFTITDVHGRPLQDEFEIEHERELHLIVVRRDAAIYQHLHPRKEDDGSWSTQLMLPEAGVYRAYADFKLKKSSQTLATDLFVPGAFRPRPLPDLSNTARAEGLDVELSGRVAPARRDGVLSFLVTRNGRPVTDLQDYLGARGHLVALRAGDLAYLHVHPTGGSHGMAAVGVDHGPSGTDHVSRETGESIGEISFAATFPSAGRYRLFLQFKVDGKVRTVAYTVNVPR